MTSDLFLLPDKCQADRRAGESNAKLRITNKRTDKPTRHRKTTPGPQTASGKNHRKIRINSIRLTMSVATVRLGVQPRKTRRVLVQKGASQPRRCCQRDCALVVSMAWLHQTGCGAARRGRGAHAPGRLPRCCRCRHGPLVPGVRGGEGRLWDALVALRPAGGCDGPRLPGSPRE